MHNIKQYRKLQGISQDELASKTGISKRMISYYENKAVRPPIDKLKSIATALNLSVSKLLQETDQKNDLSDIDPKIIKRMHAINKMSKKNQSAIWQYIDFMIEKNVGKDK